MKNNMDLKKVRKIYNWILIIGISIIILGGLSGYILGKYFEFIVALGVIVVLSDLFVDYKYYRCPYYKDHLYIKSKIPDYCPSCGKKLD